MVLRRTNGGHPLGQLKGEMDRLLEDFFGTTPGLLERTGVPTRTFPPVNIWEEGDHLFAEAELPGLKNEDVDVAVMGDTLTIKGRRATAPSNGMVYHRQERIYGEFSRAIRLPVEVDADKVEAALKDGVLRVKLPKSEAARPRKIPVAAAN